MAMIGGQRGTVLGGQANVRKEGSRRWFHSSSKEVVLLLPPLQFNSGSVQFCILSATFIPLATQVQICLFNYCVALFLANSESKLDLKPRTLYVVLVKWGEQQFFPLSQSNVHTQFTQLFEKVGNVSISLYCQHINLFC